MLNMRSRMILKQLLPACSVLVCLVACTEAPPPTVPAAPVPLSIEALTKCRDRLVVLAKNRLSRGTNDYIYDEIMVAIDSLNAHLAGKAVQQNDAPRELRIPYQCDADAYDERMSEVRASSDRASAKWAEYDRKRRQAQALEAIIDQAQDDVLKDYERRAVKHIVATGPGPRVDTFVLKDGRIVLCKTTITNGGKAVDCH